MNKEGLLRDGYLILASFLSLYHFFRGSLQLLSFFYECRSTVVHSSTVTPNMQPNLISFENQKIEEGTCKNYRVIGTCSSKKVFQTSTVNLVTC